MDNKFIILPITPELKEFVDNVNKATEYQITDRKIDWNSDEGKLKEEDIIPPETIKELLKENT